MGETFTPGPWYLQSHGSDASPPPGFSLPGVAVFATALDGHDIKTRYSDDNFICGMWSVISDEDRANAALIAAAPDLYEALTKAAETFRVYERLHLAKDTPEGIEKAKANARHAEMCEAALASVSPQAVSENGNVQGGSAT